MAPPQATGRPPPRPREGGEAHRAAAQPRAPRPSAPRHTPVGTRGGRRAGRLDVAAPDPTPRPSGATAAAAHNPHRQRPRRGRRPPPAPLPRAAPAARARGQWSAPARGGGGAAAPANARRASAPHRAAAKRGPARRGRGGRLRRRGGGCVGGRRCQQAQALASRWGRCGGGRWSTGLGERALRGTATPAPYPTVSVLRRAKDIGPRPHSVLAIGLMKRPARA